ncbi:MAG: O-antigen ligase family protein, partial [Draconibacterium sp.]
SRSLIGLLFFNNNNQLKKKLLFIIPLGLFLFLSFSSQITTYFYKSSLGVRVQKMDSSTDTRLDIWRDSWKLFSNHAIEGIGPGNYREFSMRVDPSLRAKRAAGGYVPGGPESGYLKILYDTGIVGITGFTLFFLGTIIKIINRIIQSSSDSYVGASVSAGFALIVFALNFVTLFTPSDSRICIIFIIMYAILNNTKKRIKQFV